jgi:hypothetical protein
MTVEELLRRQNAFLAVFDLALGSAALLAPDQTLRLIGHDAPSEDARHLFRRCGPIWLTFSAAHWLALARGKPADWWALAWLRGTEMATDIVWAESPAVSRPGAKAGLRLAGAYNVAVSLGFAWLARRSAD